MPVEIYKKKDKYVEAIQNSGTTEERETLMKFINYNMILYKQICEGDYILRFPDGTYKILNAFEFNQKFNKVDINTGG